MPENLNDTAATLKQNTEYERDRTHPEGKPYSRKQREAIAAYKGKTWLYNEDHQTNGVIFEGHEVKDALADGWVESPLVHPNNPTPVEKKPVPEEDYELKALWAEVDRLDIKPRPHHRSGKNKLMDTIARYSDG